MKEEEIRPAHIFDQYLELTRQDIEKFFGDSPRTSGNCPACGKAGEKAFDKHNFDYEVCPFCQTLFVNPRPTIDAFSRYYTESESSKFWATTFYKETAAARREKLWKPKARMVAAAMQRYNAADYAVIDVGGGYGLFAEEMGALLGRPVLVIEPASHLAAVCRNRQLPVLEKFLEQVVRFDLPEGPKVFASFELFEHLHSPAHFVSHLRLLMNPGDIFLFTTLSGAGVDIQSLWEDSKSVSPPHHLNFFNPHSVRILLKQLDLDVLEVSTPGKLDIDILYNNRDKIKDRFWKTFVDLADVEQRSHWQATIAETGFSSHMMTICRKLHD